MVVVKPLEQLHLSLNKVQSKEDQDRIEVNQAPKLQLLTGRVLFLI